MNAPAAQFLLDYARHRAAEGRGYRGASLRALPYLDSGPFAAQWSVRACSYEAFIRHVVWPLASIKRRKLDIIDLGAGNGWLCHRLARMGHQAVALDVRGDDVDGLGAAAEFLADDPELFKCVLSSFDDLPFDAASFDIAIFNASLHYAHDLNAVLEEAVRVVRQLGVIVILDSPFYTRAEDGAAMVAEKREQAGAQFGARADVLMGQDFIEYLTRARLGAAHTGLCWSRRRVWYPLWYEMRPLQAALKARRPPSRFDLWLAIVP